MKISSLIALILFFFQSTAEIKASIEGQVLRAGTDMPLSGVQVTLRQIPTASQPDPSASLVRVSAATDSNGKFVFPSLDPGSYAAYASSDGYAIQYYGVRGSGYAGIAAAGTPPSIKVVAGQSVADIAIHLTPTGVVSGRLTGPNGAPASGMRVALIPSYFDQTGRRATVLSAQGETDDRGQYRLFNAEPGRYYVTIQPTPNPDPAKREKWTVLYPGVEDFARAAVIEVKAGAELGGIDVALPPRAQLTTYTIKGRLIDARNGQPPQPNWVNFALIPVAADLLTVLWAPNARINSDGTFEVKDVATGSYFLSARVAEPMRPPQPGEIPRPPIPLIAYATLDVRGDINDLSMSFGSPVSVSGKVNIEDAGTDQIRVSLETIRVGSFPVNMVPSPQPASPKPDGTFSIDNVNPGEYQVRVSGLSPDAYVQELRFGDVDALSAPIRISASTSDTLKIAVSSKSGQLEGTVMDRNSKPVSGSRAVLIPDQLPGRVDLYKTADADVQGHFVFRGIAPGDYKVFAWEDLPPYAYFDLAIKKEFEESGKKVHIAPSSKSSIELTIIPANDR